VGHLYGGVWGAIVFLLLEETLSHFTVHWQLGFGALLLAVVLLVPNGVTSVLNHVRKEPSA
jgi:branched-chain amino acid transport system permease protein